ncbi:MAG: hypothetical protein K9M98_09170 [Cephaloticoccus sp.]|nr:hypothetical protein [Cephaloticoccus sp.]MCF7760662.1 hypothetical protein [Cephaloticoccus sp.]
MFSSPLLEPERSQLPPVLRNRLGSWLSGPPRGPRTTRYRTAIFQLDRLGDAVLTLSAIRLLLQNRTDAESLLVLTDAAAPLLAIEFPAIPRIVLPTAAPGVLRNILPLWRRARPQFGPVQAEQTICLSHNRNLYKEVAVSWLDSKQVLQLDRRTYPQTFPPDSCFELEAHRQLLAATLQRRVTPGEVLPRFDHVPTSEGMDLLVCPLASETIRCIPASLLLAALGHWRRRSRAPITLCGQREQSAALQNLAATITAAGQGPARVVLPAGIPELVQLIAEAGAVLAAETGPAHIATALDKRVITVVGGGTHGLCYPWRRSERQQIISNPLPCYGCGWQCTQSETYCLTGIDAATLAAALPPL